MSKKLWGGRFKKKMHPIVERYTASIMFDKVLVFEDILGSLAHTNMLSHCGIITKKEGELLKKGLEKIASLVSENKIKFFIEDEDIHMNIERLLHKYIGPTAGKLHTARSRNDQVALDLHLYLRKKILSILDLLVLLQNNFLKIAEENEDVILPGYTHLQRAQPLRFSQYCFAYISMFARDIENLKSLWPAVNTSPLGACALSGTILPTNKEYVAKLLGFDAVYASSLDAVSDRDFVISFLAAASLIMMHISRLSEEWILWSTQEFNFISFDDAFCTGSSMMPQKKNPDVAELGRGKTGRVYGSLISLLSIMKSLPLAYNKDLQEDKEPLFDTIKTLEDTLSIYSLLLSSLKINKETMKKALEKGFLNATVFAEYLVKKGLAFRQAHEVVGQMVAVCIHKECALELLTLKEMQSFCKLIKNDVYRVISPLCIEKTSKRTIQFYREKIKKNQQWLTQKSKSIKKIYDHAGLPFIP